MKKKLAIAFLGIFTAGILASCGTQKVHCDAYGGRKAAVNTTSSSELPS